MPRSFWKKLGENGFLCPQVDEKYGGLNAEFGFSVVASEEFDRVNVGLVGIGLHSDITIPYIETYGTEEQKKRWLPGAVTGDIISAIAMAEPNTSSDLANIKTTAIPDGDYYILNGEKTFITNGHIADIVIVVAKTDPKANPPHRGISLLVVETDTPGFSRGKKLRKVGQHMSDTAELIFQDVKVPKENLLGEEGKGFYYLMEKLQQERIMVAIQSQASCELMFEETVRYVKERTAFGQRIADFQNTQFTLAELKTEIEIARRFRDVAVSSIYAGTNEIMKTIIAKNIGL